MKTRHWIGMTALSCAGIAVAFLPPRPTHRIPWSRQLVPEYQAVRRVGANLRLQIEAVGFLEARDVAMARLADQGSPSHLVVDSALPPIIGDKLELMFNRDSTLTGVANSRSWAVGVFPYRAREEYVRFVALTPDRIRYLMPAFTDGETCLSVVLLGTETIDSALAAPSAAQFAFPYRAIDLLGPCASVGRFGLPGPAVSEWLASGAIESPGDYDSRCQRGHLDGCRDLVLGGNERRITNGADEFSVLGPSGNVFGVGRYVPRFDRGDHGFIVALADSIGHEAMVDLWTSDESLERAFVDAAGVPIEEWTRGYARRRRGDRDRDTAFIGSSTPWQALAVIAGASALAVTIGIRRQVTPG